MYPCKWIGAVLAAVLVLPVAPAGAIPQTLDLRTRLYDAAGDPIDDTLAIAVSLWDAPIGGSLLYDEQHAGVLVSGGLLHIAIGAGAVDPGSPLPSAAEALAAADPVYVEIEIEGETLSPRQAVDGVAYAFISDVAEHADSVGGMQSSDLQPRVEPGCSPGQMISDIHPSGGVTCRTDEGAEYTAGKGLVIEDLTFHVDRARTQLLVRGSCPAGSYITAVASDGSVICALDSDEDTTLSAGAGLRLNDTVFIADPTYLQRRIAGICPAGTAIRIVDELGAPTCEELADGDITQVQTFTQSGLVGGCASGTCDLAINTSRTQQRMAQDCGAGAVIRTIAESGDVTCQAVGEGTLTGISAAVGSGVNASCDGPGNNCSASVDFAETQHRPTTSCAANRAMQSLGASGVPTCPLVGTGDITGVVGTASGGISGGCHSGTCTTLSLDPTDFMKQPTATFSSGEVFVDQLMLTPEDVATRSITAPSGTAGTVVAMAAGEIECNGNCASNLYSVLTTSTVAPLTTGRYTLTTGDNLLFGTFVADIFPIDAGETLTIRWRAGIDPGFPAVRVFRPRLSLLFIPN